VYYNTAAGVDADGPTSGKVPQDAHPRSAARLLEKFLPSRTAPGSPVVVSRPASARSRSTSATTAISRRAPVPGADGAEIVFNPLATVPGLVGESDYL